MKSLNNKKTSYSSSKCFVCDNDKFVPAFETADELIKCTECGFIVYKNVFDPAVEYKYDESYFEGRYYDYLADKKVVQKNFANRLKIIKQFINKGKILEIGCAYGFFLELAKKDFDVHGIDIAEAGIKYARNVLGLANLESGNYLEKEYPENFFDAVCMFDTIEHLKEPHLFLSKAANDLKSGGFLCITTGDIGSFNARIRKNKWRLIYPPEHQIYFSYNTLELLLNKLGFQIVHHSYPGYWRSLGLITYLTVFKNKPAIVKSPLFKFFQRIPIYLNLFDIMYVVAQKK